MAFLISVPLVGLIGALYFQVRYFIDKYNFVCMNYIEFESKGSNWRVVVKAVIIGIFTFQLLTSCVLMSVSTPPYIYLGITLAVLSLVMFIVLLCKERSVYIDDERVFSMAELDLITAKSQYTHPTNKDLPAKAYLETEAEERELATDAK